MTGKTRTELSKALAKIRIDHDDTSRSMAQKLSIGAPQLYRIEKGLHGLSSRVVQAVKEVYGVDISQFQQKQVRHKRFILSLHGVSPEDLKLLQEIRERTRLRLGLSAEGGDEDDTDVDLIEGETIETVIPPNPEPPKKPATRKAADVTGVGFISDDEMDVIDGLE